MKTSYIIHRTLCILACLLLLCGCGNRDYDRIGKTEVTIETDRGRIVIRLYDDTPTCLLR